MVSHLVAIWKMLTSVSLCYSDAHDLEFSNNMFDCFLAWAQEQSARGIAEWFKRFSA